MRNVPIKILMADYINGVGNGTAFVDQAIGHIALQSVTIGVLVTQIRTHLFFQPIIHHRIKNMMPRFDAITGTTAPVATAALASSTYDLYKLIDALGLFDRLPS